MIGTRHEDRTLAGNRRGSGRFRWRRGRGALIGEIASNDPGKGAAWGAAVGGIAARRRGQQAQQQVQQQGQQAQAATAEQIEKLKKAFSVCLEAKDYLVRF